MKKSITAKLLILLPIVLTAVIFPDKLIHGKPPLTGVVFIPQWAPQAQFAGYYVALDKGIYQKHGLNVTLLEGGPDQSPDRYLREGKADLAGMWLSTGVSERAKGNAVVEIAQIVQKSSLMLVARKRDGIKSIPDIHGKKVGIWDGLFGLQMKMFLRIHSLRAQIIPQTYSINLFLQGGVDLTSAMWYNEYHNILNAGYDPEELQVFFLSEQGLNFPEDGIFAREAFFRKDPAACTAFVRATIEGWQEAFRRPDEAVDIVLKYMLKAHVPVDQPHQKWMLARMKDLMIEKDKGVTGILSKGDYEKVSRALAANGFIETVPEFEDFYKGERTA